MKKGIHPVLRSFTCVLRDGSSIELGSVFKHRLPYFTQKVKRCGEQEPTRSVYVTPDESVPVRQDTTNHPTWTGEDVVQEDTGMVARFRRKYQQYEDPKPKKSPSHR